MVSLSSSPTVIARLRDWWHGYSASEDAPMVLADEDHNTAWPDNRIGAVQMVCGDGASTPGGGRFAKAALKHLGLKRGMTVVDYAGQLGLFGRVAAKIADVRVIVCEPDPALAEAARQLTRGRRLTKHVSVHDGELIQAPVHDQSCDAVIAVEAMLRLEDRPLHLAHIARMLRPGGRFLLIDFFRETPDATTPSIEAWSYAEPGAATLPRLENLTESMRRQRLRLAASHDITDDYVENVVRGLSRLAAELSTHPPDGHGHAALLREVAFWGNRLHVLRSGDVSVQSLLVVRT